MISWTVSKLENRPPLISSSRGLGKKIQAMKTSSFVPLADLKPAHPIEGWETYLQDGNGYLKTALAAHARRQEAFTAEILYNIIAMAIEKFVMAALMRQGTLPYNHTMRDLAEAMDETFPGAIANIRDRLLELDTYQDICDLDVYKITPPGMEKVPAMLDLACKMQRLVAQ